jgi:hypothetical protein
MKAITQMYLLHDNLYLTEADMLPYKDGKDKPKQVYVVTDQNEQIDRITPAELYNGWIFDTLEEAEEEAGEYNEEELKMMKLNCDNMYDAYCILFDYQGKKVKLDHYNANIIFSIRGTLKKVEAIRNLNNMNVDKLRLKIDNSTILLQEIDYVFKQDNKISFDDTEIILL